MQQLLKDWRGDAVHKHQYESAIYIGDKLLAITSKHAKPIRNSKRLTIWQTILATPFSLPKRIFQPEITLVRRAC